MKHAKKLTALMLCLVLALGLGLGVYADYEEIIYPKPRWSYVSAVSGGIDNGTVGGSIILYSSAHYTTIDVTVQKFNSGWEDTSIVASAAGYKGASASKPVSLSTGLYRAKVVFRVYTTKGGAYLEGDTLYTGDYRF